MHLHLAAALLLSFGTSASQPDPSGATRVAEKSDVLEFGYAWPHEVDAIPPLARRLEAERDERRTFAARAAREDKASRGDDAPFFAHSYSKKWRVSGQSTRLLSLEADLDFYSGGAHPNALFDAILWDRQRNRAIALTDWFAEPRRALAGIEASYCPALDRERLKRREGALGEPGTWETQCPPLAKQVVVPVDKNGDGSFERIAIKLPPYEAGPYAEGAYVVEVPVTAELVAGLKAEYRPSFSPCPLDQD